MRLRGCKVLVTGGAGFLGSHLCEKLCAEGAKVRVLDLFNSGRETNLSAVQSKIELIHGNIACEKTIGFCCEDVDAIVHLAFPMALRHRVIETEIITEILAGHLNLIQEAISRKAFFINVSSIAVYGDGKYTPIDENHPLEPVLIHGAVKLACENFCRTLHHSHGLRTAILRVADIYGPKNTRISVPIKFLLQAMQNKPITLYGDGSDSRTYTFVSDFTEAVVQTLIRSEADGGIFNISGDQCVSMKELALEVKKITGSNVPIVFSDSPAAGRRLFIDNRLSKRILGFESAFPIEQGLTATYQWLKDNSKFYQ